MSVNVVLGAGGPTGYECVKRLLEATNLQVRAVVRDPSKYAGKFPSDPRLEVVAGDVTDRASLEAALRGAAGVIFAASGVGYWSAKDVDYQGVVNTAEAAKAAKAERVVLVSSMLTHPSNRWHPVRILLNNIRYSLMDRKYESEEALKASGVPFAVLRPGGLTNGERGQNAISADRDVTKEVDAGSIPRADVAALAVEALTNPGAAGSKFSIYCRKPAEPLAGGYDAHVKGVFAK
ncbi:hypothetical protein Rsub_09625 [Raphidocelis subcapitata]|uniref:NAD(P)-binding domain-containing protein n=1 Tax=Raphidocelis subcapitata TaxID=307507 RepID=A0A2V0PB67_9CHLO|nr:hypothetical protein Rsub_09625 [Raphidocelis subcapitata]|eukprot:GBF96769.1 hypothetical protein Rsub_09625 [Raphidocelis subcapitata]